MGYNAMMNTRVSSAMYTVSTNTDINATKETYGIVSSNIPARMSPITNERRATLPGHLAEAKYQTFCLSGACFSRSSQLVWKGVIYDVLDYTVDSLGHHVEMFVKESTDDWL